MGPFALSLSFLLSLSPSLSHTLSLFLECFPRVEKLKFSYNGFSKSTCTVYKREGVFSCTPFSLFNLFIEIFLSQTLTILQTIMPKYKLFSSFISSLFFYCSFHNPCLRYTISPLNLTFYDQAINRFSRVKKLKIYSHFFLFVFFTLIFFLLYN